MEADPTELEPGEQDREVEAAAPPPPRPARQATVTYADQQAAYDEAVVARLTAPNPVDLEKVSAERQARERRFRALER